jgi:hypothetical protein
MSQSLEMPDDLYAELQHAAELSGLTPVGWIAAHLPATPDSRSNGKDTAQTKDTLAVRFAGRVGRIASGGQESLSESNADAFTDYLEAKKAAGHL